MKTPTHMLVGYLASRVIPGDQPTKSRWVIFGAAAPDIPLMIVVSLLWLGFSQSVGSERPQISLAGLIDCYYFCSRIFITLHHLLHAPVSLMLLSGLWIVSSAVRSAWNLRIGWFLAGAATHSIIDIFTHAADGILLFWPLNWTYRFDSGVDQWDMAGTGGLLLVLEGSLCAVGALFMLRKHARYLYEQQQLALGLCC